MDTLTILAAALVGILGTARLTRLVVHDTYPPAAFVRKTWDRITKDGQWSELVHCHYCAAPYLAAVTLAWGLLSDFHVSWWLFYGWLALSYLAAIVVSFDGDE